jgi:hypothetical protein
LAFDRLRRNDAAGQSYDPADIDIVKRGHSSYGQQYLGAAQAQPTEATSEQPQGPSMLQRTEGWIGQADPNSYLNIGLRGATNLATAIPDTIMNVTNAAKADAEKRGQVFTPPVQLGPDATQAEKDWAAQTNALNRPGAYRLPSQMVRSVLGIPEMGADASPQQRFGEAVIPMIAGGARGLYGAYKAAQNIPGIISGVTSSALKNIVAPFVAGTVAPEVVKAAGGGELAQTLSGIVAAQTPGALAQPTKRGYGELQKSWFGAPERDPLSPSGREVGTSMDQVRAAMAKYLPDQELPQETYSMLAGRSGMATEKSLGSAGALPATAAADQPAEILARARELAIVQRKELPLNPANDPQIQSVLDAAQNARDQSAQAKIDPWDVHDRATLDAMENWIGQMRGKDVDVTDTYNKMRGWGAAPGGAPAAGATNVPYSASVRDAINQQADDLKALTNTVSDPITGQPRMIAKFDALRDWRGTVGNEIARPGYTKLAVRGPAEKAIYGAVSSDIGNSAQKNGVNPDALSTAMEIEHRELAAKDLATKMPGDKPFKNVGGVMDMLALKDPGAYARLAGGEWVPAGAPAPAPGSGDIRQTLSNLATLGRSQQLPRANEGWGLWRTGREFGAMAAGAIGGPFAPLTAALGPLWGAAAGYGLNWARAAAQQNPTVRNVMAERVNAQGKSLEPWLAPYDPYPGILAADQADALRKTVMGEGSIPKTQSAPSSIPPDTNPWLPPSPRSGQRLGSLPTTSPILAAFNAANVGNPRSVTG